jgi:quinoprotein glucose dehydrogenase
MKVRWLPVPAALLAVLLPFVQGQVRNATKSSAADWPMYNRDLGGTRFSPLAQINAGNVARLTQAWIYRIGKVKAEGITGGAEMTPIVVNGTMYLTTNNRLVALEPETGKELWSFDVRNGEPTRRGVAFWPGDGSLPPRIFFTSGQRLIAVNAYTGEAVSAFGKDGEIDMVVPYDSAPLVYKNLLLAGTNGNPGATRAFDARTGAKVWEFRSVPQQAGDPGADTWDSESYKNRPGATQWGFSMTLDAERGTVYAAYDAPGPNDYYGGDRPGANLFGSSIVALDAGTGKMKWYFQVTHHDLWDYDLPSPAALIDLNVKGERIPALVAVPKHAHMYILNRLTGKPVFGVEERPVPVSDVPGERSSLTQPFPLKPPVLARDSYKPEDIVTAADTNEEHAKFCRELADRSGGLYNAGPFTPYLFREEGAKPRSTVLFPGSIGGVNWGGTASDPGIGLVFVNTNDEASIGWIEKTTGQRGNGFRRNSIVGPTSRFQWSEGDPRSGNIINSGARAWPCQKPPWGNLIAVNANTGDIAWKVPFGITDDLPEGKKNTGRLNMGGPIATAGGLVFIGATNDKRFRAFDSKTGKELWSAKLDMSAHAVPITYQGKNGRQYVAIVAGGASALDDPEPPGKEALVVFALP